MEINKKNMTILGAVVGGPSGVKSFGGLGGALIGVIGGMAVGWAIGWVREWADARYEAKADARAKAMAAEARSTEAKARGDEPGEK